MNDPHLCLGCVLAFEDYCANLFVPQYFEDKCLMKAIKN